MTHNAFGVDTAFPPPPPPQMPGYPPLPPGPPAGGSRRWPVLVGAAIIGAVVSAVAAFAITTQARDTTVQGLPAPTTGTVAAPTPAPPVPLSAEQADRQTCGPREEVSRLISAASEAQGVIPQGMTILDPAVRSNPAWTAGVLRAGSLYTQAGDVLKVAPGTTPALAQAVTTAASALHALGTAYTSFNAASGNAHDIAKAASNAVDDMCQRLAP